MQFECGETADNARSNVADMLNLQTFRLVQFPVLIPRPMSKPSLHWQSKNKAMVVDNMFQLQEQVNFIDTLMHPSNYLIYITFDNGVFG